LEIAALTAGEKNNVLYIGGCQFLLQGVNYYIIFFF
jgi:hypothetical protein